MWVWFGGLEGGQPSFGRSFFELFLLSVVVSYLQEHDTQAYSTWPAYAYFES